MSNRINARRTAAAQADEAFAEEIRRIRGDQRTTAAEKHLPIGVVPISDVSANVSAQSPSKTTSPSTSPSSHH